MKIQFNSILLYFLTFYFFSFFFVLNFFVLNFFVLNLWFKVDAHLHHCKRWPDEQSWHKKLSGQSCQIRDILGHGRWRPVRFWTKPATWLDEKRPPVVSLTALASHWSKPVTWHSRRVRSAANYLLRVLERRSLLTFL